MNKSAASFVRANKVPVMCAGAAALFLSLNIFSQKTFDGFVRKVISEKNDEIVRAVSEQYLPMQNRFNTEALEIAGMIFMHDGFIIDVEDSYGEKVWDARDMDMEHCVAALRKIGERMEGHGKKSEVRNTEFPLFTGAKKIGSVNIASVGPFFYTEAQSEFITRLNIILGTLFVIVIVSYTALTAAIRKITRDLQNARLRQKQLTGDVAHELRTPLCALRGTIEALSDGVWEATPERLRSMLDEIKRLTKLAEDLQTLSSFDSGNITLNKTEFDMAELLKACAEQFERAAAEKDIVITTSPERAEVYADYDRIKQVMINLFSNAVKYTDSGTISAGIEKKEHGAVVVRISDSGRGVSKEDLPHIFERFYRAEKSRSRETGGAGAGLTIALAICEAHGWTIRAESEEGKGSVFSVVPQKV